MLQDIHCECLSYPEVQSHHAQSTTSPPCLPSIGIIVADSGFRHTDCGTFRGQRTASAATEFGAAHANFVAQDYIALNEQRVTIWGDSSVPQQLISVSSALELGMKFQTSIDGFIKGLRFYKGLNDSGSHFGRLWSAEGTLLATTTFVGETDSGWQEQALDTPVPVSAGVTYVVSYHSVSGVLAYDGGYFAAGVDNPPLRALADGEAGPNGVIGFGAGVVPELSAGSGNFWVDVVFISVP